MNRRASALQLKLCASIFCKEKPLGAVEMIQKIFLFFYKHILHYTSNTQNPTWFHEGRLLNSCHIIILVGWENSQSASNTYWNLFCANRQSSVWWKACQVSVAFTHIYSFSNIAQLTHTIYHSSSTARRHVSILLIDHAAKSLQCKGGIL